VSGGVASHCPPGAFSEAWARARHSYHHFWRPASLGGFDRQASLVFEYPFVERRAPKSLLYNLGFSYPVLEVGRLTEGQVLLELNGKSEWGMEKPETFSARITPGFRQVLTRREPGQRVGFQLAVTGTRDADYSVLGYLSYEYPPFRLRR